MTGTRPTAHGLARQRTTLSWQRTALDFAVIGGLFLHAAEGLGNPIRLIPAALALGMAGVVLVTVRLSARTGRRPNAQRAVAAIGVLAILLQLAAAVLLLPIW